MNPIGTFTQPTGKTGVEYKQKYYAKRHNLNKGNNSTKRLGWQIMILFLGTYLWINIQPWWINKEN